MIKAVSIVASPVVVVFIIVVFIIAHCRTMHDIAPHGATAAPQTFLFPHQLLLMKVVLNTSDAAYYFRVKNGLDYQNGWVEPQLLISCCQCKLVCSSAY